MNNSLLHLIGNSVDDAQVIKQGNPNTNGSTDPSHSQLAKDHDNHPFHTLAAVLAKEAVRDVGESLASHWKGVVNANPGSIAAGYLIHPFDSAWQDSIVAKWARANPAQVKRGESATEWEALRRAHEQEVRDGIKKSGERSKQTWDYLNREYETLFGETNQVKK